MRVLAAIGVIVLGACPRDPSPERATPAGAATPAPSPSPPAPTTEAPPPSSVPKGPLRIAWANVTGTDGCFFFSGPDGRDDRLVGEVVVQAAAEAAAREGTPLLLRIGTARFEGSLVGGTLELVRRSTHEFDGRWEVHETMRGRMRDGELRATYRYEECQVGAAACPDRCTLTADVVIRR